MRCGQHRRCQRAARRRHTSGVQRGVCALHVRDLPARVHLRARQPTRRGRSSASGGARTAGTAAARAEERVFIDIDSLLRPVYGHHKQGASFGHAKIASRALLRLGLSPQITTISTTQAPPVIAEARLRSGRAGSGRAAASQIKQAIGTARACGPCG